MNELSIGEGAQVTLHFSLEFEGGEVVDSNFDSEAVTFTFGDGSLLPGFEQVLTGLKEGAKESFVIPPEKGFGQPNPSNIQIVSRASFDDSIGIEEGLVVSFKDASGGELPGVIRSFNESEVEVDFNHPLAGRNIIFKVHIVAVDPAVTH